MRQTEGSTRSNATTEGGGETYAEEGAAAGLLAGLGLGALAGLGVLSGVIPVIGPAIAGGTLGILISNAAAGLAAAGLAGALIGYGIPEEEAKSYQAEFEAGRTIVTVTADGRYEDACDILHRYGARDTSGGGSVAAGTMAAATGTTTGRQADTLQVKEERLRAEKRPVETGEVNVRKEVRTETEHLAVPVEKEEVVIERTPVHGRAATEGVAGDIREGEQLRIPVREEKVDVGKEAVVTEEVKVGKRVVQDTEQVGGEVRKEEVKVERKGDVDVRTGGTGKGPK